MTNFEKIIKEIKAEELAKTDLLGCKQCIYQENENNCYSEIYPCENGIVEWLKMEVRKND